MNKQANRDDIENQVDLIRYIHNIAINAESRDVIADGLMAHIGILLNEVDYWRSEYDRVVSFNIVNSNGNIPHDETPAIIGEVTFICPHCEASYENENLSGLSWIKVGGISNEQGYSDDIGYVHCSNCGKDSPLYSSEETAFLNWCIEEIL